MQKLFWVDLEMTGLNVETEVIIEVAAIVTDLDFTELACFETAVKQPQSYLDNMDAWNTEHHGASGLTAKVPQGMPPESVEDELIKLIQTHFPDPKDRPVLAGNSIGQDRVFINKHMPRLAALLHYRMLDVSSWKIIFNNKYNFKHDKQGKHRALDDIRESISELKAYLKFIQI